MPLMGPSEYSEGITSFRLTVMPYTHNGICPKVTLLQLSDITRILKGIKNNDLKVNYHVAPEVGDGEAGGLEGRDEF